MFDLKVMNSVLAELEEERGIPRAKVIEAIEAAMATAYKKEYAKKGQIIRARIDLAAGTTEFQQVKTVVDDTTVRFITEEEELNEEAQVPALDAEGNPIAPLPRYNEEQHIKIEDAKFIKRDAAVGEELVFPLEAKDDYGRIAAQTAKQVIIQKIREAEKVSEVAVASTDSHVDPVGSLVGQRGVRVSTVTSELGGEKIDIVEWSEDPKSFIEEALSPARIVGVELDQDEHKATIKVAEDQQSLAIGRGGQNVRLAAKLTGWRIDIQSVGGPRAAEVDGKDAPVEPTEATPPPLTAE